MALPSNALCVDRVVLSVRSNETDVDDPIRIVNPHHDPILVAREVEYHTAVLEDARAADGLTSVGVAQSAALTCRYQAITGSRTRRVADNVQNLSHFRE